MMALEAIKLITGAGEALTGRLLIYDALAAESRTVRLAPDSRMSGLRPDLKFCSPSWGSCRRSRLRGRRLGGHLLVVCYPGTAISVICIDFLFMALRPRRKAIRRSTQITEAPVSTVPSSVSKGNAKPGACSEIFIWGPETHISVVNYCPTRRNGAVSECSPVCRINTCLPIQIRQVAKMFWKIGPTWGRVWLWRRV